MRPIDKLLPLGTRTVVGGRLSATAGGAGDNTATNLTFVDRIPADTGQFENALLVVLVRATLAQGATATLTTTLQDATAANGAGAAAFGGSIAHGVIATGGTGGSTEVVAIGIPVMLSGAREFVAARVTIDLSAANTDTATVDAVWVLGGSDRTTFPSAFLGA